MNGCGKQMAMEHLSLQRMLDYKNNKLSVAEVAIVKTHLAECEICATKTADVQYWDGFMECHLEEQGEDIGAE